mmetsp:Transcript_36540/g.117344  ORF Transcript_36540/g.117344 Transcript_36540/m.117344 type:complete len:201 (-) Transcript_36540:805-1407(-)|eukprot:scaffold34705_cov115-Isochrysis_galbana.AAC.4
MSDLSASSSALICQVETHSRSRSGAPPAAVTLLDGRRGCGASEAGLPRSVGSSVRVVAGRVRSRLSLVCEVRRSSNEIGLSNQDGSSPPAPLRPAAGRCAGGARGESSCGAASSNSSRQRWASHRPPVARPGCEWGVNAPAAPLRVPAAARACASGGTGACVLPGGAIVLPCAGPCAPLSSGPCIPPGTGASPNGAAASQ